MNLLLKRSLPARAPSGTRLGGLFSAALRAHVAEFGRLTPLEDRVLDAGERLSACLAAGGKVLLCGHGLSAPLCQHLAMMCTGSRGARGPLAVLALPGEGAQGDGLARQVQALGRAGDALLLVCAGADAAALRRAADQAAELGMLTVGLLSGACQALCESCHVAIVVPGERAERVAEAQQFIGHVLVALIEAEQA